jgi:hypothetical protein
VAAAAAAQRRKTRNRSHRFTTNRARLGSVNETAVAAITLRTAVCVRALLELRRSAADAADRAFNSPFPAAQHTHVVSKLLCDPVYTSSHAAIVTLNRAAAAAAVENAQRRQRALKHSHTDAHAHAHTHGDSMNLNLMSSSTSTSSSSQIAHSGAHKAPGSPAASRCNHVVFFLFLISSYVSSHVPFSEAPGSPAAGRCNHVCSVLLIITSYTFLIQIGWSRGV